MKKPIFTCLILMLLGVCSYAQNKTVAVVTFYINKQIDVTEFGTPVYLAVAKLDDDPQFNLTALLKTFHASFFDSYAKQFPFQLLPEDQVTGNAGYQAFVPVGSAQSGILDATKYIVPFKRYKIMVPLSGNDNESAMLKLFNQVDGVMDVSINFKLVKIGLGGMGVVKVMAKANMVLFNRDGTKVFSLEEDDKSKLVNALIAGVPVMTAEKIMPMCESAMDELMSSLEKDMPKLVKKANAKL